MGLVETVNGKTVTRRVPVGQAIEEMQASWYETEFILAPHFVFDDANWKDKVTFQQPWRFSFNKVENPNDTSRPALRLSDGTHNICSFSFELFISKDISGQFATQNEINLSTKKLMEEYTGKSQENAVCNLQPKNGKGAYCIFTNVNLTMISMGIVKIDDYIFKVRGYYDANGKTDFKDFLTVLESLKIEKR